MRIVKKDKELDNKITFQDVLEGGIFRCIINVIDKQPEVYLKLINKGSSEYNVVKLRDGRLARLSDGHDVKIIEGAFVENYSK